MRRELILFALGAAMSLTLVGCTSGKAPDVTPVPTPAVTDRVDDPMTTGDAGYDAGTNGHVQGSTPPSGTVANNDMDKAGKAVRNAADDVRRDVDDMMY